MRIFMSFLLFMITGLAFAKSDNQVFISFSMPHQLLMETAQDAANHDIPLVLNGLYQDSMRETAVKIFELSKKIPNLSIQIDPTAFERYHITQVPALVSDNHQTFDVVFGNIRIERALDEIARLGDTSEGKS